MQRNDIEANNTDSPSSSNCDQSHARFIIAGVEAVTLVSGTLLLGKYATIAVAPCMLFNLACLDYVVALKERATQAAKNIDKVSIAAGLSVTLAVCGTMVATGADVSIANSISSDKAMEVLARSAGIAAGVTLSALSGLATTGIGFFVSNKVDRHAGQAVELTETSPLMAYAKS